MFNLSGGSWTLIDFPSTQLIGVANGGTLNISGTAVLDATFATVGVQTNGIIDIASNWTGSWTWGTYSGTEWRDHFVASQIRFNGSAIDGATFDSTFRVTNGGQTLALIPEPSTAALLGLGVLAFLRRRR